MPELFCNLFEALHDLAMHGGLADDLRQHETRFLDTLLSCLEDAKCPIWSNSQTLAYACALLPALWLPAVRDVCVSAMARTLMQMPATVRANGQVLLVLYRSCVGMTSQKALARALALGGVSQM